jgi:small subunit ribosomal protein S16
VPQYRIVVVDSRKKRDGKVIEEIGKYHPKEDPSYISVVSDRAQYWLGVGAQPSEAVAKLLKITGDWQTFKGYKGTEGTLKVAEPKRDKLDIFNEALADAHGSGSGEAVTKKAAAKKAAPKAETDDKADKAETPEKAEKADKPEKKAKKKADITAPDAAAEAAPEAAAEPAAEAVPDAAPEAEPAPVPASETPEGAAAEAEAAETAEKPDSSDS